MRFAVAFVAATLVGLLWTPTQAEAHIVRLEIRSIDSPAFGGLTFGDVGQYEMLYGRAYGEVNPSDRRNAVITDLMLAPRNARGMVEYWTDVHILRPLDPSRGNGRLILDIVNRGNKAFIGSLGPAPGRMNRPAAGDALTGYTMRMGYTTVWIGWESSNMVEEGGYRAVAGLPIAKSSTGDSVVGKNVIEFSLNDVTTMTRALNYRAATMDQSEASLTIRNHANDLAIPVPATDWSYASDRQVRINRGSGALVKFDAGALYQLAYPATDPGVGGLGFAATRDVIAFLRRDTSVGNPLNRTEASRVQWVLAFGGSQSGRMLKTFLYLGFNEDEAGQMVLDGINPHISGAGLVAQNDRFGDANATARRYVNHHLASMEFPFTYAVRHDPISGRTDGLLARCQASNTCPKVIHTDSGNEAWLKGQSLVTTDGSGHDIELPENVRVYYFASTQHGAAAVPDRGICQQLSNPLPWGPSLLALFVALDNWTTRAIEPPASRYPRVADGTLVPSMPQLGQGFPTIPGVTYFGPANHASLLDKTRLPYAHAPGKEYTVLVPKTDGDGNDVGGVRAVDLEVPLGTHTGWGLRRAGFAENEDCDLQGQYIPFAPTRAARIAAGDPRLSIEERYSGQDAYVNAVSKAATNAVSMRLLLKEDADRIVDAARLKVLPR